MLTVLTAVLLHAVTEKETPLTNSYGEFWTQKNP